MVDNQIDRQKLKAIKEALGYRILVTNQHNRETSEIVKAYYGQACIEHTFRDIKNPYHLAIYPQYHWTNQKIRVHFYNCVLGYLLVALNHKQLKEIVKPEKSGH